MIYLIIYKKTLIKSASLIGAWLFSCVSLNCRDTAPRRCGGEPTPIPGENDDNGITVDFKDSE